MENQSRIGAVYIRVSTNGQMELSPESQLREVLHYAESREIEIPASFIFMEKEGHSGKRAENRPEFQRMIATAKLHPRPFDVILVWKFSRFARNQDESTFYKGMLRKKLGIDVISVSEPVIDGMYGRLIELIIEWQDEFYSYNLSSEVRRGMAEHARQGGYQAPAPYGYRHDGPGCPPSLVEHEADVVRLIFSQYTNLGYSPSAIAVELNEKGITTKRGNPFDRRAVLYILQNPFYTGKIRWNPKGRSQKKDPKQGCVETDNDSAILADGRHEAIVTEEQFQLAQRRLRGEQPGPEQRLRGEQPEPERRLRGERPGPEQRLGSERTPRGTQTPAAFPSFSPPPLLSASAVPAPLLPHKRPRSHCLCGILRCPICGAALSYNASQSPVFQCWRYARGLHKGSASVSERRAMSALLASLQELEQSAPRYLEKRFWQPDPGQNQDEDRQKFSRKMKALSLKEQRILAAYENGIDSLKEYQAKKERITGERLSLLESGPSVLPSVDSLTSLISSAEIPTEIKSRALCSILAAAVYDRGENRFHFYYRRT